MFTYHYVGAASPMAAVSAENTANEARRKSDQASRETAHIQRQTDRLFMIVEALWTFMKQHHGYTDEQLMEMVNEIDLQDGALDGKVRAAPQPCPQCKRTLVPNRRPVLSLLRRSRVGFGLQALTVSEDAAVEGSAAVSSGAKTGSTPSVPIRRVT